MTEVRSVSSIPSVNDTTSTHSAKDVGQRISNYIGHAVQIIGHLHKQNTAVSQNLNEIYKNAQQRIEAQNKQLQDKFGTIDLKQEQEIKKSKGELKKLKKALAETENEIVAIIHETQIEAVAEIAQQTVKDNPEKASVIRSKVITLAKGGLGAKWIRFLSIISKTNQEATGAFREARSLMAADSERVPEHSPTESVIDADKRDELRNQPLLHERAGVIGLNGIYRIHVYFSKKKIKKQLKSFFAQNLGEAERTTIERNIRVGEQTIISRHIPLNKEFDISVRSTLSTVFSNIFGKKGISSANRQEPHLVNGYESSLIVKGKTIFRALRHAITADRNQKDPTIRAANSKKAAEELLKAALLQEIAAQGLTIQQASEKVIQLNLNSVSLVTPDDLRPYLPGQINEQQLLLDQVLALKSLAGGETIELDGVKIRVQVKVNTFNFGVNYLATNLGWGLHTQYELNLAALNDFGRQCDDFARRVEDKVEQLRGHPPKIPSKEALEKIKQIESALENAQALMNDIVALMWDEKAYLKGDNQYEIGAKIINLTCLMDQIVERINQDLAPDEKMSGYKGAFNCMSGKDRTGFMDAVAKALALLAESSNGRYPTHTELMQPRLQKEFADILVTLLLEGGGQEITEINTGARGYKVGEEARLFGISRESFLQIQGLSATAGA